MASVEIDIHHLSWNYFGAYGWLGVVASQWGARRHRGWKAHNRSGQCDNMSWGDRDYRRACRPG